jgi:hypothetical protein
MSEMNLNEFLRARYTTKLQNVLQEFINDVSHGPKDLGVVAVTAIGVALDFCEQCSKLVGPTEAAKSYAKFLDDIELIISNRFTAIRGQIVTLNIEAPDETKH